MTRFAGVVVRLLEQLRDLTTPEGKREPLPPNAAPEESRAPKRPWEEMSREHELSEVVRQFLLGCRRSYSTCSIYVVQRGKCSEHRSAGYGDNPEQARYELGCEHARPA